jgi:hypothetical protein
MSDVGTALGDLSAARRDMTVLGRDDSVRSDRISVKATWAALSLRDIIDWMSLFAPRLSALVAGVIAMAILASIKLQRTNSQ